MTQDQKLEAFADLLEWEQIMELQRRDLACAANLENSRTSIKLGKKYIKVDVGGSGKYMVEASTGNIFGIKAYGVIHRGHQYGNLDTIHEWNWGGYQAIRKEAS